MLPVLHYLFHKPSLIRTMLLSKEYVGYLAREVTKKLIAGEFIETKAVPAVTEKVHASMLEEFRSKTASMTKSASSWKPIPRKCGKPAPIIRRCFAR